MCQDVLIPNNTASRSTTCGCDAHSRTPSTAPSSSIASIFNQGTPGSGPITHLLAWAYTPETRQLPHDVVAARRLLDEAGFKAGRDGERFAITFTHAANQQRLAQALRQQPERSASR